MRYNFYLKRHSLMVSTVTRKNSVHFLIHVREENILILSSFKNSLNAFHCTHYNAFCTSH